MKATVQPRSLTRGHILSYGLGELGTAIFIHAPNLLWLFFLTEIIGLDPTTAGLVILAPMVWDAVTDPLFGVLADKTWTQFGKYVPYLALATPFCGLSFVLFFTDPGFAGSLAAWAALGTAVLFRTLLTVVIVPHNALLARSTQDSRVRSVLAGSKMFFNAVGMVLIAVATRPMLSAGDSGGETLSFAGFAVAGAVIATLLLWQNAFFFRRLDASADAPSAASPFSLGDISRSLVGNRYLLVLIAAGAIGMLLLPAFAKSLLYYGRYVVGEDDWGSTALIIFTLCVALSIPFWGAAGRRLEKADLLRAAHFCLSLSLAAFLLLPAGGGAARLAVVALVGIATGGINVMTMALLPDVVEAGQASSGQRVEAPVFGCFTFALKLGNGLGSGLVGLSLGSAGFMQGVAVQSPATQTGILLTMTLMPIVGALVVLVLLRGWDLTHAEHGRLKRSLT
ncbi:MFS transporter [Erythrobacter sp.]|uniref:MFS transporter n=1 Tax=Erythrobacter sp. TaxID=1042 RepID=UPI002EA6114A|nr:MFS transporter [Erythrobacter sp.]